MNAFLIGSSVFAGLAVVTNRRTHTNYGKCDVNNSKLHQCDTCDAAYCYACNLEISHKANYCLTICSVARPTSHSSSGIKQYGRSSVAFLDRSSLPLLLAHERLFYHVVNCGHQQPVAPLLFVEQERNSVDAHPRFADHMYGTAGLTDDHCVFRRALKTHLFYAPTYSRGALSDAAIWCILGLWLLYRTLIGSPMLEVEPPSQRGCTAAGSGQDSKRSRRRRQA